MKRRIVDDLLVYCFTYSVLYLTLAFSFPEIERFHIAIYLVHLLWLEYQGWQNCLWADRIYSSWCRKMQDVKLVQIYSVYTKKFDLYTDNVKPKFFAADRFSNTRRLQELKMLLNSRNLQNLSWYIPFKLLQATFIHRGLVLFLL